MTKQIKIGAALLILSICVLFSFKSYVEVGEYVKIIGATSGKVYVSSSTGSYNEIQIEKPKNKIFSADYTGILKIVKEYEDKGYTLVQETVYTNPNIFYSYLMKK